VPPGGTLRAPEQPAQSIKTATEAQAPAPAQAASTADPDATPEPYASKGLHLTGRITMGRQTVYTFAVSNSGQRISTLDSRDLEAMGYKWQPLTDCAGTLRWKGKAQAITCDAPVLAQGAQDRPVVVEVDPGRASVSGAGTARGYRPSSASPAASPVAATEAAAFLPGAVNPRHDAMPPKVLPPGSPFQPTPSMDAQRPIGPPTLQSPYRHSTG